MTLELELYWSFRSPYSYLVTARMVQLVEEFEVQVAVRPVLPIAIRDRDFFDRVNPLWPPYLVRDVIRLAESLGTTIRWPRPDPVLQVREGDRLKTAEDQPYAPRLTRLGVAAAERGRGLAFIDEVSRVIWDGTVDGWHEGSNLADASARAGLDLAELETALEAEPARFDAEIERNQKDQLAAGHWGVPLMVFQGEPFFGQDRFDLLVWRLKQQGLARRRPPPR